MILSVIRVSSVRNNPKLYPQALFTVGLLVTLNTKHTPIFSEAIEGNPGSSALGLSVAR